MEYQKIANSMMNQEEHTILIAKSSSKLQC